MSLTLYSGFVGSGKSYHATAEGLHFAEALRGDGWVVANFPVKPRKSWFFDRETRWLYFDNEEFSPEMLVKLSIERGWDQREGSCLLIFDEAGILFNARDWARAGNRADWIKFFSQSRKFGYDIIFIAQDMRMLDRQIRALCEYEVVHRKLNHWAFFKLLPCTTFACIKYWNGTNARYSRGSLSLSIYRKSVADRYDTAGLFGYGDTEDASQPGAAEQRSPAGGGKGGPDAAPLLPAQPAASPAARARKPPASGDCQDPTQQVPAPTVNP